MTVDVVVIGDLSPLAFMAQFPKVYRGTHLGHPKIQLFRAHTLEVQAHTGHVALLEAEGELLGRAPAHITVLPRALRLKNH